MITQPDGKQRVIDNARLAGHNAHTQMLETIHTVSVDFVANCARDVFHAVFPPCEQGPPPECDWLCMRLGTDDLPDAYRGHPVQDEQSLFGYPRSDGSSLSFGAWPTAFRLLWWPLTGCLCLGLPFVGVWSPRPLRLTSTMSST